MTKDELLERGDETVTIRQIVERFEAVEEEYNGVPWTLKQIYTQIDMLVSEKPKMGKWKYIKKEDSYKCGLCGFPCHKDNLGAIPTKYCAGCGAVMEV